jgi:16S rRNA (guanine527-N7)-methyltransferase
MTEEEAKAFVAGVVSRETIDHLRSLAEMVERWSRRINLVSPSTQRQVWSRHIADSAQLWTLRPGDRGHWVDIGSGGGFPGLVVALCAKSDGEQMVVSLIESDRRKAAFLRTASVELGLDVRIYAERAEKMASLRADVVSARAVAPLVDLMPVVHHHVLPEGVALLPKGKRWRDEWAMTSSAWSARLEVFSSVTDEDAVVLRIGNIERATGNE